MLADGRRKSYHVRSGDDPAEQGPTAPTGFTRTWSSRTPTATRSPSTWWRPRSVARSTRTAVADLARLLPPGVRPRW